LPIEAINPINGQKIPIFIRADADYGLKNHEGYVLSARLAIPSLNELDKITADSFKLNYQTIIGNDGEELINSDHVYTRSFLLEFW
jgi:leucyl-tRNA synthetase